MRRLLAAVILFSAFTLAAQPRPPLTRALADALYAKLAGGSTIAGTTTVTNLTVTGTCTGCGISGVAWGVITGTLSNQTDLQGALNLKAPLASPTFTGHVTVEGVTATGATGANKFVFDTGPAITSLVPTFTDVTTGNVSIIAHGLAPKGDNVATHFLDGTGAYTTPAGGLAADGSTVGATSTRQILQNGVELGSNGVVTGSILFRDGTAASTKFQIVQVTGYPTGNKLESWDFSGLTAARNHIWPNLAGTIALTANNLSAFASTTSAQLSSVLSDETGSGLAVFSTSPAVTGLTSDTLQTSGNVGVGVAPSGTSGLRILAEMDGNQVTKIQALNTDATDTGAAANVNATADASAVNLSAFGSAFSGTLFGLNLAGSASINNGGAGTVGFTIGTTSAAPIRIGTNSTRAVTIDATSQAVSLRGTQTNDNATAGDAGEYQTGTVAANTTSLSTGTSINVGTNTNITLAAGDWDCSGVVNFTFGATTSITNLSGGISTTTGTLPAQDSYFDYETAAMVPTGTAVATWIAPTVRLSNSGSTNVFLVAQGTFTLSTVKVGGTIRCRRMR